MREPPRAAIPVAMCLAALVPDGTARVQSFPAEPTAGYEHVPLPGAGGVKKGLGPGSLSAAPRAPGEEARPRGGRNPREGDLSAAPFKNSALLNQNHLFGFVTVLSSRFLLLVPRLCQPAGGSAPGVPWNP